MTIHDEDINGGPDAARCDICGQLHGDNGHTVEDDEAHDARVASVIAFDRSLESLVVMRNAIRRQAIVSGVDFPTPALNADIKKAGGR